MPRRASPCHPADDVGGGDADVGECEAPGDLVAGGVGGGGVDADPVGQAEQLSRPSIEGRFGECPRSRRRCLPTGGGSGGGVEDDGDAMGEADPAVVGACHVRLGRRRSLVDRGQRSGRTGGVTAHQLVDGFGEKHVGEGVYGIGRVGDHRLDGGAVGVVVGERLAGGAEQPALGEEVDEPFAVGDRSGDGRGGLVGRAIDIDGQRRSRAQSEDVLAELALTQRSLDAVAEHCGELLALADTVDDVEGPAHPGRRQVDSQHVVGAASVGEEAAAQHGSRAGVGQRWCVDVPRARS